MYVLGVDVGTTGTKAMLIDQNGSVVATAYKGYPLITPREGYVDQKAEDWWDAFVSTSRQCIDKVTNKQDVLAVSLSTQGGSMVPIDKENNPLCDSLVWMDSRGAAIEDELREAGKDSWFYLKTGWKLSSGLFAVKILWLKQNRPDVFHATHKYLSTLDYVNMKLTGKYVIDPTNAGITQLMNLQKREWDPEILDFLGITKDLLPEILPSGAVVGNLTSEAAKALDLPMSTVVVNGGHDQYCAATGAGALHDGDVIVSTGTCWVALAISSKLRFDEVTHIAVGAHIPDGLWGALTSFQTAGLALEWFKEKLGPKSSDNGILKSVSFKEIDEKTCGRLESAKDLFFFPTFSGRGFPTWESKSKASLLGLSLEHDAYDIARAVMEGVAFELKHMLEGYASLGFAMESLRIMGGATKSDLWTDIIANTVDCRVIRLKEPNIACLGAAIMAGAASGVFESYADGFQKVNGEEMVCPVREPLRSAYIEKYKRYKKGMAYTDPFYATK
jgi:sugar (pentulose or hexulose) kinase